MSCKFCWTTDVSPNKPDVDYCKISPNFSQCDGENKECPKYKDEVVGDNDAIENFRADIDG